MRVKTFLKAYDAVGEEKGPPEYWWTVDGLIENDGITLLGRERRLLVKVAIHPFLPSGLRHLCRHKTDR